MRYVHSMAARQMSRKLMRMVRATGERGLVVPNPVGLSVAYAATHQSTRQRTRRLAFFHHQFA